MSLNSTLTGTYLREQVTAALDQEDQGFDTTIAELAGYMLTAPAAESKLEPDAPYQEFLAKYPSTADSHVSSHKEYHGNAEVFETLESVLTAFAANGTLETLRQHPAILPDTVSVTEQIRSKPDKETWKVPPPQNHQFKFTIKLPTVQSQKAFLCPPDKAAIMLRHVTEKVGSGIPALVSAEPSPHSTDLMSVTFWAEKCEESYLFHRLGSAAFTGVPISSKFSITNALPNYAQSCRKADKRLAVTRRRLRTELTKWLKQVEAENGVWALSLV